MRTWNPFRRRRHELRCRQAVELVTEYLEGALDPQQSAAYEGHLAECAGCLAYLSQMIASVRLLGQLEPSTLPVAVRDELVKIFDQFHNSEV